MSGARPIVERYPPLLGPLDCQEVVEEGPPSVEGSTSRCRQSSTQPHELQEYQHQPYMPPSHARSTAFPTFTKRSPTDTEIDAFWSKHLRRAPQGPATTGTDFFSSTFSDPPPVTSSSFTDPSPTTARPLSPASMIVIGSTTITATSTTTDTSITSTSATRTNAVTGTSLDFATSPPPTSASNLPGASNQPSASSEKTPVGAIVGGVLGGLAMICITIIIALYFFTRARSRRRSTSPSPFGFGFNSYGSEGPSMAHRSEPITQWLTTPSKVSLSNDSRGPSATSTNLTAPRQRYHDMKTGHNTPSSNQDIQSSFISGRPPTVYSSLSVPGTLPEYCNPVVRDSEPPPFYRHTVDAPKLRDPPLHPPFVSPSL